MSDASVSNDIVYSENVLEDYPYLSKSLKRDDRIFHNASFESVILMVQENQEDSLSKEETSAVSYLLIQVSPPNESSESYLGFIFERAAKRLKATGMSKLSPYVETRFLITTANICERFFSIAV